MQRDIVMPSAQGNFAGAAFPGANEAGKATPQPKTIEPSNLIKQEQCESNPEAKAAGAENNQEFLPVTTSDPPEAAAAMMDSQAQDVDEPKDA